MVIADELMKMVATYIGWIVTAGESVNCRLRNVSAVKI